VDNKFDDIDEEAQKLAEERSRKGLEISSMFKACFVNPQGKKTLRHLKKTFVDRDIYQKGLTFEETTFRQGEASVIRKILTEIGDETI